MFDKDVHRKVKKAFESGSASPSDGESDVAAVRKKGNSGKAPKTKGGVDKDEGNVTEVVGTEESDSADSSETESS